jgi:ribosomal protein S8
MNNLTHILSKLHVAEKKKKKMIVFSSSNCSIDLLNLLWKDGFIYGYSNIEGKIIIFLKYFNSGSGLLSNVLFLKKQKVSLHKLQTLSIINKNSYYLVWTTDGILSHKDCLIKNISGFLIARL